jgi:hypothetical protein
MTCTVLYIDGSESKCFVLYGHKAADFVALLGFQDSDDGDEDYYEE